MTNFDIWIPLLSDADIYDKGDAWRTWSCIYLAYLLRDAIESLSKEPMRKSSVKPGKRLECRVNPDAQIAQRGNYLTRRPGKYWWKTLRDRNICTRLRSLVYSISDI